MFPHCSLLSLDALPVHALAQVDLSAARARRDAGEKIPMTIDVLGRTITVELVPNRDLLPTSYVLQTVGEDGTLHTVPSHVRRDCYYTGRVEGNEGSHVAVEICKDYEMVSWDVVGTLSMSRSIHGRSDPTCSCQQVRTRMCFPLLYVCVRPLLSSHQHAVTFHACRGSQSCILHKCVVSS